METAEDQIPEEEEIFGAATGPIAPLSPLGPLDIGDPEPVEPNKDHGKKVDKGGQKTRAGKPRTGVYLNEEVLHGENGIRALSQVFEGVKFLGKGREKEDLALLLGKYEQWAHVMFPKHQFIDVVDKVEHLFSRRQVRFHAMQVKTGEQLSYNENDGHVLDTNENMEELISNNEASRKNSKHADIDDVLFDDDFGEIDLVE